MSRSTWSPDEIADQSGRTFLVTGPTHGGLGHHTALELARHGGRVILAGRNPSRSAETAAAIRAEVPGADLVEVGLDLASLDSVRQAAEEVRALGPLHVLVNNAGVMAPPYGRTIDGFETQMATNHFGPFLLTGLLLDHLVDSAAGAAHGRARVTTVSSQLHRWARSAPLGDPRVQHGRYDAYQCYGQSKLANLLFTFELERRLAARGLPVDATAAHPGFAGTHLAAHGRYGRSSGGRASILDAAIRAISQPAHRGAWPTLMAALDDLPSGSYVGPESLQQMRGRPTLVEPRRLARDETVQRRLWELSEEAVGLSWP